MRSHLTANVATAVASRGEVAELKAWARRAWWATRESPRRKAGGCLELALGPLRFVRDAARVFATYAPIVSRELGAPRHRQLRQIVVAHVRHGLDPIAYYRFRLFEPARWAGVGGYVQNAVMGGALRWLVAETPGYPRVFGDKRAFDAWCAHHGLPSVPTLLEIDGRIAGASARGDPLPAFDLLSKPANSQGGDGVVRWIYRDGAYLGDEGLALDAGALVTELARRSAAMGRPILVQRLLRNPPSEACFSTGGLCTIRVATTCRPGGDPQPLFSAFLMPAGDSAAGNFNVGGLAARVDLATGRVGRAVRKDLRLMPVPAARHPDTGATIEGHQLPHWPAALALARRAHRLVDWPGVPIVGWDLVLLEEGPVLLEGNNIQCATGAQMVLGGPLGDTVAVGCINAHLRERFAPSH